MGMELDELDRELAEYNKHVEPIAPQPVAEEEKPVWTPFGETDDEAETKTAEYEMQYTNLERVKHKLEEKINSAREEYLGIEKQRIAEKNSLKNDWIATVCFLALLWAVLMILKMTPFFIAWVALFVGLLFFTFRQLVLMINRTIRYQAMSITDNASPVVETHRLKTYAKQEAFQHDLMSRAQAQLDKVEAYRKKLEANRFLSEEDMNAVDKLAYVEQHEQYYNNDKFDLEDWFKLKRGKSSL